MNASKSNQENIEAKQHLFFDGEISPTEGEKFYKRLLAEAPYIPGDKCDLIPAKDIPWCDRELLNKGILFSRNNIYSIIMASTASLMFGFAIKSESIVLLRSGKFNRPEKSFVRFLSTVYRIGTWIFNGVLDETSEGFRQIKIVRKLHSFYAKSKAAPASLHELGWTPEITKTSQLIRNGLIKVQTTDIPDHLLSWDPQLNMSQFNMALTQFGFIGILFLFPESMGLNRYDAEGMKGFFHFWAVVGRLLGIEDRFNLALHPDPIMFQKIYSHILIASMKSSDETAVCLQNNLSQGLSGRLPVLLTLKGWIYYGLSAQIKEFQGEDFWNSMKWNDKASYFLLKASFILTKKSRVAKFIMNAGMAVAMQIGFWIYLPKNNECV